MTIAGCVIITGIVTMIGGCVMTTAVQVGVLVAVGVGADVLVAVEVGSTTSVTSGVISWPQDTLPANAVSSSVSIPMPIFA